MQVCKYACMYATQILLCVRLKRAKAFLYQVRPNQSKSVDEIGLFSYDRVAHLKFFIISVWFDSKSIYPMQMNEEEIECP